MNPCSLRDSVISLLEPQDLPRYFHLPLFLKSTRLKTYYSTNQTLKSDFKSVHGLYNSELPVKKH